MTHEERLEKGMFALKRRADGVPWKIVAHELGFNVKTVIEFTHLYKREMEYKNQWHCDMSPSLRRTVLANGINSAEEMMAMWNMHNDNLQNVLRNVGPKLMGEIKAWVAAYIAKRL